MTQFRNTNGTVEVIRFQDQVFLETRMTWPKVVVRIPLSVAAARALGETLIAVTENEEVTDDAEGPRSDPPGDRR